MKIRAGFVSNSSTTSFCIYGVYFDSINKKVFDADKDKSLRVIYGPWDDDVWVGRDLSSVPDDMTMGDFKKETEAKLKEIFGDHIKCRVLESAWRDG